MFILLVGPEEYNGELPADQAGDQAGMEVVPYTGQPGILPEDTAAGGIPGKEDLINQVGFT